ncbi:MAG: hypothetical protein ACOY9Y_05650 [Bacillota bacterium]
MGTRKLVETSNHSSGAVVAARKQGHAKQLEKPSSSRTRNRGRKVGLHAAFDVAGAGNGEDDPLEEGH